MIRQFLPHANVFIFGMFARTSGVPKLCVSPTHLLSFVYQAYSQSIAHCFHLSLTATHPMKSDHTRSFPLNIIQAQYRLPLQLVIRQYVGLVYKGPNLASTELDIGFGLQPNKYYNKFQDTLLKSFTEHARIQHKIEKSNNYTATISRDLASML